MPKLSRTIRRLHYLILSSTASSLPRDVFSHVLWAHVSDSSYSLPHDDPEVPRWLGPLSLPLMLLPGGRAAQRHTMVYSRLSRDLLQFVLPPLPPRSSDQPDDCSLLIHPWEPDENYRFLRSLSAFKNSLLVEWIILCLKRFLQVEDRDLSTGNDCTTSCLMFTHGVLIEKLIAFILI